MNNWADQTVLITGVCGTVGRELLKQLVSLGAGRLVGIDNNEEEVFLLSEDYREHSNVELFIGDIRDRERIFDCLRSIDIVLHAAALKHVLVCEDSPRDAVQTNILGVQNIVDAAWINGVKRVLFTSSDKAVNPTNVMGTSKLMGERLMTAANARRDHKHNPVFASTRFGNVLGSRGSVIPIFRRQISTGGPVTVTDPGMTRFIMNLEQAVGLVLESVFMARGGEVFITKMPVVRIYDLAQAMILELATEFDRNPTEINIVNIGPRVGEKYFEELMNGEEARRTIELENFLVVLPAFDSTYEKKNFDYPNVISLNVSRPYNSSLEQPMGLEDVRRYLRAHGLVHKDGLI
jgi:FlaA1/EpsC-like NDP-sugar epimerase